MGLAFALAAGVLRPERMVSAAERGAVLASAQEAPVHGSEGAIDMHSGEAAVHEEHGEHAEGSHEEHAAGAAAGAHHPVVPPIPMWAIFPFLGILLSIAVIPLAYEKWWHHNFPKVCAAWSVPTIIAILYFLREGGVGLTLVKHTTIEYMGFLALLTALFTVTGGILLRGHLKGGPVTNTIILAIGSVFASFVGTTGAAMILIRPLIRANKGRKYQMLSIIFFIFLVCNIGGSLTPLGDPPLFLGFLRGVPFTWCFQLLPMWAFAVVILLVLFFILDTIAIKKEGPAPAPAEDNSGGKKLSVHGTINFFFVACVLGVVILYSKLPASLGVKKDFLQIGLMLFIAFLSVKFTKKEIREENGFTWFPIKEVAILFAGIFACMIPALQILEQRGAEFGVTQPWQFFWATGITSSFLDNAPTYLTFSALAKTIHVPGAATVGLLDGSAIANPLLLAIACGAVFMGANTYIGNAPNFMVKSIAEENHIKMPSFFGYMAWSGLFLVPLFILITYIFFLR